jgi:hypothetical protein
LDPSAGSAGVDVARDPASTPAASTSRARARESRR